MIRIVRPWERGIIERLGKYKRTAESLKRLAEAEKFEERTIAILLY